MLSGLPVIRRVATVNKRVVAWNHGTITPSGTVSVEDGKAQSFVIVPDNGYEVEDVVVDGKSVGPVTEYTFNEVTESHTISATFKKISEEKV